MGVYHHNESQEMYIKDIYKLTRSSRYVRAVDVCEDTGYAKSSVSRALKLLRNAGYIEVNSNIISFTEKGILKAEYINERYSVLRDVLAYLGLGDEVEETACEMEHIVTESIYLKLKDFLKRHQEEIASAAKKS